METSYYWRRNYIYNIENKLYVAMKNKIYVGMKPKSEIIRKTVTGHAKKYRMTEGWGLGYEEQVFTNF